MAVPARTTQVTPKVNRRNRQDILAKLAGQVRQLELPGRCLSKASAISTGCPAMDNCLPTGGYAPGSMIEYLRSAPGCGASYLALMAAASALRAGSEKHLVIVDTYHQLYPPAVSSQQIDLQQVIWVRPQSMADAIWATDQALRNPAVAAVVADLETLDARQARRLQLAAQRGGGLGLLLRGLSARRLPSWAEVQWIVRSLLPPSVQTNTAALASPPLRRLEVVLARLRGGTAGARLLLEHKVMETGLQLVPPTSPRAWRQSAQSHTP
ncbi:MAG: hypothetical protein KF752_00980 [Pirellulaceae bacterium]|nr:hypothetical protein [Pirellulaceae bacterium]